jgi:hypothetical protein
MFIIFHTQKFRRKKMNVNNNNFKATPINLNLQNTKKDDEKSQATKKIEAWENWKNWINSNCNREDVNVLSKTAIQKLIQSH